MIVKVSLYFWIEIVHLFVGTLKPLKRRNTNNSQRENGENLVIIVFVYSMRKKKYFKFMIAIQYIKILQIKISIEADLNNRYIITWMLHQIFIYSNKVILAAG